MTLESFVAILVISATATSIGIEIIKNTLNSFQIKYNTTPVAVITAFMIGFIEIMIHTISIKSPITYTTFIYALCMGIANAIGSNVGYDKIKAFIYALNGK